MDVLTPLIAAAFYVLFAVSIWRYLQHRGQLELAVVLVFTSTAALFAVSFVNSLFPAVAPVLRADRRDVARGTAGAHGRACRA